MYIAGQGDRRNVSYWIMRRGGSALQATRPSRNPSEPSLERSLFAPSQSHFGEKSRLVVNIRRSRDRVPSEKKIIDGDDQARLGVP